MKSERLRYVHARIRRVEGNAPPRVEQVITLIETQDGPPQRRVGALSIRAPGVAPGDPDELDSVKALGICALLKPLDLGGVET